ncbi:bZIP transcription factor [Fonsecaea pedrosoi]|nr:bZIP transcription factor [Fonsecaea pedrosoi]
MQRDPASPASHTSASAQADYNLSPPSLWQDGRKRKNAPPGSRSVDTLTPEQLAKKRANDREAQRAIRERTKQTIENLERRIQELTSHQPYQELEAVIRQKDAIQAENEEIRRRLASVMSIIQPIVGAQGLTDLATAAQHNVQAGLIQTHPVLNPPFPPSNGTQASPTSFHIQRNGQTAFSVSPILSQGQSETPPHPPQLGGEVIEDHRPSPTSRDALNNQRDNLQRGLELNEGGERVNFGFLLDLLGQRTGNARAQTHPHPRPRPRAQPGVSSPYPALPSTLPDQPTLPTTRWSVLPKISPPTCPLDSLLLKLLQSRQRDPISGANALPTTPSYPSVSSLLNPSAPRRSLDDMSQLMTDIISKFPNISGLPEQVATLFIMFTHMRWQIHPTKENYERLPEWFRPTPAQIFQPHPAWMEHIPWPRMRDRVVVNPQDYPFDDFFFPFTADLSVNWPYDPVDCLLSTSEKEEPVINPVFESHIRRLENWSLGPLFAETYPNLVETVRIKENEPGPS